MSVLVSPSVHPARSSTLQTTSRGVLLVKGAPESILERCTHACLSTAPEVVVPLTATLRSSLLAKMQAYGEKETLRCLAFAMKANVSARLEDWDLDDTTKFAAYEVPASRLYSC